MRAASFLLLLSSASGLVACTSDVDEQWDLDHDRIIAVRATKPGLVSGERAELVGLLGYKHVTTDATDLTRIPPDERSPIVAAAVQPMSLAGTVTTEGGKWFVTAPSEEVLVAARTELKLDPGAPVPLIVGTQFSATLAAITTVRLGISAENPTIGSPTIGGAPAPADATTEVVIPSLEDVRLETTLATDVDVNWLTSVGQMHDFDLPKAYVRVEVGDPTVGQLVVVIRDRLGGVAWSRWSLRAQ
ncbi:MAG: hypothetical protein NT062_02165 [Proteobacteria bacterium]|nr:hypothetical protein [Pseudomonadota bacterium]